MKQINNIIEARDVIADLKYKKQKIALVPTMGALHDGHLSLINKGKQIADKVIVSIFVNRQQFNDKSDFDKYPRNLRDDLLKLSKANTDFVFTPDDKDIYKDKPLINIDTSYLANCLCGISRSGHFAGVCLIVSKLFNIINPDFAIFGEKDFQQLQIIRRLVTDLSFSTKIISQPTLRQKDGLAISSRNILLNDEDRKNAAQIYTILSNVRNILLKDKESDLSFIIQNAKKELIRIGFDKIDYLEVRQEENLQLIESFDPYIKSRIFFAGFLRNVRLIDNINL